MNHPFPKSTSSTHKCRILQDSVDHGDTVAVLINADPDAMASALALKRFFWRRAKKVQIFHINTIKRADNLAMIRLLKIEQKHIRKIKVQDITKWAIIDSQPHHNELFKKYQYDIIIDHHPVNPISTGQFIDIREDYGATSTILTEYLRAVDIKPSPTLATALFYGIKTDTDNFIRSSTSHDINAFRYLYQYVNINIIKKIEASEMTRNSLESFKSAMDRLVMHKDIAFIHMGEVKNPDILVIMADFFLKMVEASWSVISGIQGSKFIIIFRNASFRMDAGKVAQRLFGHIGSAGGHKSAARAELSTEDLDFDVENESDCRDFVLDRLKIFK
ncbi:MAG: DHH family phosphoesterase [Deltaproteobacteria bacterium]|nr:DHH family phosphoesterase [Deltaproteobacteria bacterium]